MFYYRQSVNVASSSLLNLRRKCYQDNLKLSTQIPPKLREDRLINIEVNISFLRKKLVTANELAKEPINAKIRLCDWV